MVQVDSELAVTADGLSGEILPPISEDVRQRGIDILQGLLANGRVGLARFHEALDGLLAADTEAEIGLVPLRRPDARPTTVAKRVGTRTLKRSRVRSASPGEPAIETEGVPRTYQIASESPMLCRSAQVSSDPVYVRPPAV
jgi:hypothetical protein